MEKQMIWCAVPAMLVVMTSLTTGCTPETSSTTLESVDGTELEGDLDMAGDFDVVDFVNDVEFDEALAAWHAQAAERPMFATDEELAASDDESRGVVTLADGRVFWAIASGQPLDGELEWLRLPRTTLAPVAQVTWTGVYLGIVGKTAGNEPADGRSRTTSTTGGFKSMVKITSDGGWVGSGVIVGPRHVLTAAHNVYETNSNVMRTNVKVRLQMDGTIHAVPAAKIFFTAGWMNLTAASSNQSVVRHDYALLVVNDIIATGSNQNGGFFDVGWYVNSSDLVNRPYNLYGYPGSALACAAAPVKEPTWYGGKFGTCGDALYGMSGTILDVPTYMAQHNFDAQPGQSGGALYEYFPDTGRRVVRGIQSINVPNYGGYAHQISSESRANIISWISANP